MLDYSDKVKEYFFNPRNAGLLADANAVGEAGSMQDGDALKLMLRINPISEVIEAASFLTFGCSSAIASSSALTELIIGKTLAEAARLTDRDIVDFLDGLPAEKMHCPVMGQKALAAAIAAFRGEPVVVADLPAPPPRVVQIAPLPRRHAAPPAAAALAARLANGSSAAPKPLARAEEAQPFVSTPVPGRSPAVEAVMIAKVIEDMRPVFQRDGGDIELVSIEGAQIFVHLSGACASCMMAGQTLSGVQTKLLEALGRPVRLIPTARRREKA